MMIVFESVNTQLVSESVLLEKIVVQFPGF